MPFKKYEKVFLDDEKNIYKEKNIFDKEFFFEELLG